MKKQILLSAILSLATCNMFAADLTVTSASGDPSVEGSFPMLSSLILQRMTLKNLMLSP